MNHSIKKRRNFLIATADAGPRNFCVNWFKADMAAAGDAAPIGILLCSDNDGAEVEFATAGMDQ